MEHPVMHESAKDAGRAGPARTPRPPAVQSPDKPGRVSPRYGDNLNDSVLLSRLAVTIIEVSHGPNAINLRWNSCLGSTRTATNCTKYTKRAKKRATDRLRVS
jgi:hypothetical protein